MQEQTSSHPWRIRSMIGLLMLILSFIGLIITDSMKEGAWLYWRAISPVYAILSISLGWYLRSKNSIKLRTEIWQDVLHWLGLIFSVYIVSTFVNIGLVGQFEAGLTVLVLLAVTTFLAGIYHDIIFMIVGVILGIFSIGAALLNKYLYTIMLPMTLIAGFVMLIVIYKNFHHRHDQ